MPLPEVVTNYITNPSFETGAAGVSLGSGLTASPAVGSATSGAWTLSITGATPAQAEGANTVEQTATLTPTPGDTLTFSAVATGTGLYARLALIFRNGSTVLWSSYGPRTLITASPLLEHVAPTPDLTTNVVARILFSGSAAGATPADGWLARTDAWMLYRATPDTPPTTLSAMDTAWAGSTLGAFDTFWAGKTLADIDADPTDH